MKIVIDVGSDLTVAQQKRLAKAIDWAQLSDLVYGLIQDAEGECEMPEELTWIENVTVSHES